MSVAPGTRLGPYDILSLLGRGGMGEVYRARDTRLDREVAIKVLPPAFAGDPDRRLRFEREAKAVAALSHPNILAIYDIGVQGDVAYAVTELLDGETLRDRLSSSTGAAGAGTAALPTRKAIDVAIQVARGLAAAHDKLIVHRDLKPENVFLLADGRVKILDFGLARPIITNTGATETAQAITDPGTVMGTIGYMAPEQVRGLDVDARTDLFALGVVLYEMLGGRRAFGGATAADTMTAILKDDPPDLLQVRPDLTPALDRIVRHCLEKNPAERFRTASDVAFALDTLSGSGMASSVGAVGPESGGKSARPWLAWAGWVAAAFVTIAATIVYMIGRHTPTAAPPTLHVDLSLPDKSVYGGGFLSVSPDGRRVAFASGGSDGRTHLWLRSLDTSDVKEMPGTENALGAFWSPDSRSVGYFADGKLRRVPVSGGTPEVICPAGNRGASWGPNGVLIFATNWIFQVPASGGEPVPVTELDPSRHEIFHARPFFLPDGHHFLYVRVSTEAENTGIFVGSLDVKPADQDRKRLVGGQIGPAYLPVAGSSIGRLLFIREHQLLAQLFDPSTLTLSGDPVLVADGVGDNGNAIGYFSAVPGLLAYRLGSGRGQLTWYDRDGKVLSAVGDPQLYDQLELSPDGTQAAVPRYGANHDIWLLDTARGGATRFTTDPAWDASPVWSADASRIVFVSRRHAPVGDLFWKLSGGTREEELLLESPDSKAPTDWSRDGQLLLYTDTSPANREDIRVLEHPDAADRRSTPFLATSFREGQAKFSPDGRWVAYTSDESGRFEVYVRPFPVTSTGSKWLVSSGGGTQPRWRRDGRELFYLAPGSKLMSSVISAGYSFAAGPPTSLFTLALYSSGGGDIGSTLSWDVSPDGKRIFAVALTREDSQSTLSVIVNWHP